MSDVKEEVKPIDIKAKQDLDRLTEKYKDQKKEPDQLEGNKKQKDKIPEPQIIDTQVIEQEVEMLNQIYIQSFKRQLPSPAILSYRMGSLSYQKKNGRSPLEILDKYPFIYFVAFGLAIVNDILQNLPKRKSEEKKTENKPFESHKNNSQPSMSEEEQYAQAKPIAAKKGLN
jgi:hypothetical protein